MSYARPPVERNAVPVAKPGPPTSALPPPPMKAQEPEIDREKVKDGYRCFCLALPALSDLGVLRAFVLQVCPMLIRVFPQVRPSFLS